MSETVKDKEVSFVWQDKKRLLFFALPWTFTRYTLTDEKFLIKSGVLTLSNEEIRLYRITDMSLKQTLLQRIFGLGTITVTSNDRSSGTFQIVNIVNPESVKELLSSKVEEERMRKRVASREFIDGDGDAL